MADDLIQRLRQRKDFFQNGAGWVMSCNPDPDCTEAAAALARKDAEIAGLRDLLEELEYNRDALQVAHAQLAALRAEVADFREDSLRLDWLEQNGYSIRSRADGHRNLVVWGPEPRLDIRSVIDGKRVALVLRND